MQKGKRTPKSETSSKAKKPIDENSWREALEEISINDDDWWCIVTMMVETITEHSRCVSLFNAAAEEGRRKAIYSLSSQKTLASVRSLSKQSLDKCPAIQGVCHYASKVISGDNDRLPSWLLAQIIKYLIYRAREESIGIVKRLADLEREIDEEYWIMQTVADWGQPGGKEFDAEIFNKKADTKLRKRDEEWRDTVYVDDAPINGPNLYIILSGFHDPNLPQALINAGVPLHCMMQIKRPNERLDRHVRYEKIKESSTETRKLQFLDDYDVSGIDLFEFWTKVEQRLQHPETHPEFCEIGFLTFCPPHFPKTSNDDEYEIQKKDMYDRVSYIVYDFYDLYRQHGNYLKRMKAENGIISETRESPKSEIYGNLLDAFPLECVSVPIILFAILMQVEANEKVIPIENLIDEKGDARIAQQSNDSTVQREITTKSPETGAESCKMDNIPSAIDPTVALIEEKTKTLNTKFALNDIENIINDSEQKMEIDLTLHGDTLFEAIRLLDSSAVAGILNVNDLTDSILPVFESPNIMKLYDRNKICEKKLDNYTRHLNNIRDYFNVKISEEDIRHYLHILVFDRMIYGLSKPKNKVFKEVTIEDIVDLIYVESLTSSTKRCKSLPSLSSQCAPEVYVLSDGNIDYGKTVPEIDECSPLFDLIDPRELLSPGYLKENVFRVRPTDRPRLEDFSDVELLSRPIFLQLLHECLPSFNHVHLRYFEPTDCLLLYFGNKRRINGVHKEERMSSIRTPVRLRDFCEYVVPEEEDWLRREEEQYRLQTASSMERLMRKSMEIYDEMMLFRDEDFILPGSLKARDLEKSKELDTRKSTSEVEEGIIPTIVLLATTFERTGKGTVKGSKKGTDKSVSEKEKKKGSKIGDSKRSAKKLTKDQKNSTFVTKTMGTDSVEREQTYDFIGYDLGKLRLQVTNRRTTFYSSDDTLVQIEIDDWLYQKEDIRITITLRGYSLKLFHRIGSPETSEVFHVTSKSGIILAFQKQLTSQDESSIPFRHNWKYMNVQFRASWPTGLLIESITGDGPENPYYIQQSYISKCRDTINGTREICRKFLRNGTVLKYLDNNNIIVLRPNGVIVTCTDFEKQPIKLVETKGSSINVSRTAVVASSGNIPNRETGQQSKSKTKATRSLPLLAETRGKGSAHSQQKSATIQDSAVPIVDCTVKVSRYTVLDHDGRRYEVADDLIVSEQHRLLVRMASHYEVDEKFTRRAGDTNMLLNSKGELIVRFPDGTRITTGYTIENEPVICDWTEEDILRYFTSDGIKEDEEFYADPSFLDLGCDEEASSRRNAEYEEKIAELLITDSFVSVLLTCRVEHKNYATVSYDQLAVSCTLSMPDDLRVSISKGGHYEVSMEGGVNLKINEDTLSFKGNACTICGSQSTSTYDFFPQKTSSVLFTTIDVFGNKFELKNDGTTHYYKSHGKQVQRRDSNPDTDELNSQEDPYKENDEEECIVEDRCSHERLCFEENSNGYRIFSINRNLTAYEYIHRFTRNQVEMVATFDNKTSITLYPSMDGPKIQRLVTCEPVGAISRTKTTLSFPDYQVKPTNFDRKCLLRSTYSIPYDWLFPFGRKGNGVWKNTHDHPLMTNAEVLPDLLRIRILRSFKEPSRNAIIDLQRALGRYWMSIVRGVSQSQDSVDEVSKIVQEKSKSTYNYLEEKLRNISLGIKKTIDVETYKIGLRPWNVAKSKVHRRSPKLDEFLGYKAEKEEQLEWYKRCMKEKFILPYFQNIAGSCFLWIMDCVENALNMSTARSSIESFCF